MSEGVVDLEEEVVFENGGGKVIFVPKVQVLPPTFVSSTVSANAVSAPARRGRPRGSVASGAAAAAGVGEKRAAKKARRRDDDHSGSSYEPEQEEKSRRGRRRKIVAVSMPEKSSAECGPSLGEWAATMVPGEFWRAMKMFAGRS